MPWAILPQIGDRDIATATREPVQAVLNYMAELQLLLGVRMQHTPIGFPRGLRLDGNGDYLLLNALAIAQESPGELGPPSDCAPCDNSIRRASNGPS